MRLRPHQERTNDDCIETLEKHGICVLNGQQRVGKTLISIAAAAHFGGDILFLTKKTAIKDIQGALESYGLDGVTVINYESIHKVEAKPWRLIICDECHALGAFPKPPKVWTLVNQHFKRTGAKGLLMSGTPFIESLAKAYGIVCVTGRGPWVDFPTFNRWWNPQHHYKKGVGGGYGVYAAKVRRVGGLEAPDYAQVHRDKVMADILPIMVEITRKEAGFKVTDATHVLCELENRALASISQRIRKEGIVEVEDSEGSTRVCVYDTPASRSQGAHMVGGGTLIDEDGEAFVLGGVDAHYRAAWIRNGAKVGKQYVIQTEFIHERFLLLDFLGPLATDDLEEFKSGAYRFVVLSLKSYSMGIDFSWLDGTQILYSMCWSGGHFDQVCDRQLNFTRTKPAIVAIPLLKGGIDRAVYEGVTTKGKFNASIYREIANANKA